LRDFEFDEEPPEASLTGKRTDLEVGSSLVNVDLDPELIKKLTAAAKASGQSTTEWIHDAIAEAILRRSKPKTH
jgi:predicted HicB family RNase H-like nuclease